MSALHRASVHHNGATELMGQARLGEATSKLHAALKLQPDLTSAYENLALISKANNSDMSQTAAILETTVRLAPARADLYTELAELYVSAHTSGELLDDFGKAARAVRAAIRLSPTLTSTHSAPLADLYRAAGSRDKAHAVCAKAVKLLPTDHNAYGCLAMSPADGADARGQSAAAFARALELDPAADSHPSRYYWLATMLRGYGALAESEATLRDALRTADAALAVGSHRRRARKRRSRKGRSGDEGDDDDDEREQARAASRHGMLSMLASSHARVLLDLERVGEASHAAATAIALAQLQVREASRLREVGGQMPPTTVMREAMLAQARASAAGGNVDGATQTYQSTLSMLAEASAPSAVFDNVASEYVSHKEASDGRPPNATRVPPPAACSEDTNGGWACGRLPNPPEGLWCNVARRDGLSAADFMREYGAPGLPVVLKGGCADWNVRRRWTVAELRRAHGGERVEIARSSLVASRQNGAASVAAAGKRAKNVTLGRFLDMLGGGGDGGGGDGGGGDGGGGAPDSTRRRAEKDADPWYLMSKRLPWVPYDFDHPAHFADFELPDHTRSEKALIGIGPRGSGSSFHQHWAAWNCVAYGRKRWALLPPSSGYASPVGSSRAWMAHVRPRLLDGGFGELRECVQEAGDLLYVPGGWHHSVLNLMDSVSLAVQVGAPLTWEGHGLKKAEGERA